MYECTLTSEGENPVRYVPFCSLLQYMCPSVTRGQFEGPLGHLNTNTERRRGSTGSFVCIISWLWSFLPMPAFRATSPAHGPAALTR